jgi:LacI family transcriptional regulator
MAVTIHDVAKRAGVASSTVSRYLNGYHLREKNRLKVKQAIKELGFKENIIAKGLKRSRLMSIAVIVPHYTIFFMMSTSILERIFAKENYSLLLGSFEYDPKNLQEKLGFAEERFVNGLILFSSGVGAESIPILQGYLDKKIPVVLVEQPIPGFETDVVMIDNVHASFRAVEKLILENHIKIAIVNGGDQQLSICKERLKGYYEAMHTYNLAIEKSWIVSGEFVDAGEYAKIQKVFESPNPPTAIYATTYYATIGTVITLHQLHLKIPEDISLIGFDHFDPIDAIEPPLTLVVQPLERIASTAADILLKRMKGDYTDFPQTIIVSTQMLIRDSVRKL